MLLFENLRYGENGMNKELRLGGSWPHSGLPSWGSRARPPLITGVTSMFTAGACALCLKTTAPRLPQDPGDPETGREVSPALGPGRAPTEAERGQTHSLASFTTGGPRPCMQCLRTGDTFSSRAGGPAQAACSDSTGRRCIPADL